METKTKKWTAQRIPPSVLKNIKGGIRAKDYCLFRVVLSQDHGNGRKIVYASACDDMPKGDGDR